MARKTYCLVPPRWSLRDCGDHRCDDGSHRHLSRRQLFELERDGLIEWLQRPRTNREKGVVRLVLRYTPLRGLSCRVGALLAEAVRRHEEWALIAIAEIDRPC